jgi:hypothetical protein
MEFRHSSPEALHTKRSEIPLLAKDGTKAKEFTRFFLHARKAVDTGHIFYFSSEGRACFEDFYHTGKFQLLQPGLNPRNSGSQRPAC